MFLVPENILMKFKIIMIGFCVQNLLFFLFLQVPTEEMARLRVGADVATTYVLSVIIPKMYTHPHCPSV